MTATMAPGVPGLSQAANSASMAGEWEPRTTPVPALSGASFKATDIEFLPSVGQPERRLETVRGWCPLGCAASNAERASQRLHQLLGREADVEHDDALRLLQRRELARQQGRRHIGVAAPRD